jgi:exocyst complex component 1
LKKQLRGLEDDNITFLLSFEGDAHASKTASGKATTTSVDRILVAIETLQKRVDHLQAWSNDSSELLESTSQNMLQFESLNNQLEIHFKNSVALQETLATMMATIELPRECMAVLLRPVPIFPDDAASGSVGRASTFSEARGASQAESDVAQRDLPERLQLTIATIKRVDQAIKSTRVYPASEMAAFRARGDELARLSKTLCDKLAAAFDAFLQRRSKQWSSVSRQAAAAAAAASSSAMPRTSMATSGFQMRDIREISSSASHRYESRMSRTTTSFASEFESGGGKEMDWAFSNEQFHTSLLQYQPLLEALQSLDTRALTQMRLLYAKHASAVYSPHAQTLFRCLRDKLPKTSSSKHGGPHFTKPQALQSWSVHLSASSFDGLQLSAAPLLQQALDHLVPILTREQHFLSMVFFPLNSDQGEDASMDDSSNDELTLLMEGVFDKLLKRLNDFGEACATRNMLDALSLVVLVDPLLAKYLPQSAFLYNTLVSFQLQMKRLLIKFTDDHASWIQNHTHTDTRMAGVLSPISKTLTMVARLDECVGSKSDDATLALLFHRMVPATLQWLDKISETKPKYTALTRLENYLFIYDTLSAIIAPSSSLPLGESPESSRVSPLAQYAALAQQKYQENLQLYLASIWSYEFKQLVPLFDGIIELLKTVPVHEISFHTSRQEVRRILETVATGVDACWTLRISSSMRGGY